jgi:hypothetical protein
MCYAVTCRVCGKTTWAGCGEHVEEVRKSVPESMWCPGHPERSGPGGGEGSAPKS